MTATTVPSGVKDRTAWLEMKELDERGEGLTQWEIDFVEDLHGWLRAGRFLTQKQRNQLDRIRGERLQ